MSSPLHKHKAGRPGEGSAQASRHGGHSGALTPNLFMHPEILVLRKIGYKHMIKTNIYPQKMYFVPPNLKIWLRAWFCQNCVCN